MDASTFIHKWKQSGASERANKDSFLHDLCDVLGVPHPDPKTGDLGRDRYVFEREAVLVHAGERHTLGFIDLYKRGAFILEAKQGSDAKSDCFEHFVVKTAAQDLFSAVNAVGQCRFEPLDTSLPRRGKLRACRSPILTHFDMVAGIV